jgi:AraC-like DNA-binding protein
MAPVKGNFTFSTRGLQPTERVSAWNAAYGRQLSGRELELLRPAADPFQLVASGYTLGGVSLHARTAGSVVHMSVTTGGVARRTSRHLADGNDDIVLHIQRAGHRIVSQVGREATVAPGGGVLTSNADTSTIVLPSTACFVSIALSRTLITALAPRVEDALVRALPPNLNVLRLLMTYLAALGDMQQVADPSLRWAVTQHVYDLCALAIGAARDAAECAAARGLRAARLQAMKADLAANLGRVDVSAAGLARRQGVSPRYVHKLFATEGVTLSRYKLGLRLARVHGMLVDCRHADATISELAYKAGFNDLSTFNREFRRHFGATPSAVRIGSQSK